MGSGGLPAGSANNLRRPECGATACGRTRPMMTTRPTSRAAHRTPASYTRVRRPRRRHLWVVAQHGRGADYVRNIEAKPRVRVAFSDHRGDRLGQQAVERDVGRDLHRSTARADKQPPGRHTSANSLLDSGPIDVPSEHEWISAGEVDRVVSIEFRQLDLVWLVIDVAELEPRNAERAELRLRSRELLAAGRGEWRDPGHSRARGCFAKPGQDRPVRRRRKVACEREIHDEENTFGSRTTWRRGW